MSANSTFEHLECVTSSVSTFSGKKAGNKLCQSMASGETGLGTAKEEIMLLMLIKPQAIILRLQHLSPDNHQASKRFKGGCSYSSYYANIVLHLIFKSLVQKRSLELEFEKKWDMAVLENVLGV